MTYREALKMVQNAELWAFHSMPFFRRGTVNAQKAIQKTFYNAIMGLEFEVMFERDSQIRAEERLSCKH